MAHLTRRPVYCYIHSVRWPAQSRSSDVLRCLSRSRIHNFILSNSRTLGVSADAYATGKYHLAKRRIALIWPMHTVLIGHQAKVWLGWKSLQSRPGYQVNAQQDCPCVEVQRLQKQQWIEQITELVTHFMLPCLQLFSELGEHCSIYARQHFAGTWKMLFLEGQAK